ncbi:putative bifunctional diguanylate cyclase/phosphodiesterase [Massilia sp. PWRC2]|uniref:putative bifunctional diguanylate cyclase/phosphodiesterase n=1 Tax=Massilia sp. PWRC2 TaxID=2804626 RepID=UPI003CF90FC6
MSGALRVLLVEDCEDDALLVLRALRRGGFELSWQRVHDRAALMAALAQPWDVVLSDFSILGFSGMEALLICKAVQSDLPFILVSGTVGEEMAVALMKAGANDYVMKHNLSRLAPALQRELDDAAARASLRRAELALIDSEKRFHAFMDAGPFMASIRNQDGHYLYTNKGWDSALCADAASRVGPLDALSPDQLMAAVVVNDQAIMASARAHETIQEFHLTPASVAYRKNIRFPFIGSAGQHLLGELSTDVTALKQSEETIRRLAFLDPLTELPNRRLMQDRLSHALALTARSGQHGALLFLDLDHFKTLNDTHGHDAGDQILKLIAARLSGAMRSQDTVARSGGDEFVIILEKLSCDVDLAAREVVAIGQMILRLISAPYEHDGVSHRMSASIGVVLFCGTAHSPDELMQHADIALYSAKAAGRNLQRIFDPAMQERIAVHSAQMEDLRLAMEQHSFVLHYQPQVDAGGVLTGVEALLRMQHPSKGLVMPDAFIGLAEESGLIVELGYWTLETACAQLQQWSMAPASAQLTIAVNVSARQFSDGDFVARVLQIVERSGIDPTLLILELTESLLLEEVDRTVDKMAALRRCGMRMSLDDFGMGFSSLSYLKLLPLYEIKIDRGFVKHLISDANDAVIVSAIIALAAGFGLSVIAEGVETAAQLAYLKSQGCQRFQGYLFGRPLPVALLDLPVLASPPSPFPLTKTDQYHA